MELDEYRREAERDTGHWWYDATLAVLRQELGPRLAPGGRFLDAGCGGGTTGAWMAQYGAVVGNDVEPLALQLYRESTRAHAPVGLTAGDAAALAFRSGAFDAVLSVNVLYHRLLADPEHAIAGFARVLRPGGVLCLFEPGLKRLRRAHDRVTHVARRFRRAELVGWCQAAGLTVERATGVYAFLAPPAAVKAVLERGRTASDLDSGTSGTAGVAGVALRLAAMERAVLRHASLPAGLSLLVIARA